MGGLALVAVLFFASMAPDREPAANDTGMTLLRYMGMKLSGAMRDAEREGKRAVLLMGGKTHFFETVVCAPETFHIAIAGNLHGQPHEPEVRITLVDSTSTSSDAESASILVDSLQGLQRWQMVDGDISRMNERVEVVGYFQGSIIGQGADGNPEPVLIEGTDDAAFAVAIDCN